MKKNIKTTRKIIIGIILAILLVVIAIPMAVFLSFSSKERRDKFVKGVRNIVLDVMVYLNES